jgi:hypothetical protein
MRVGSMHAALGTSSLSSGAEKNKAAGANQQDHEKQKISESLGKLTALFATLIKPNSYPLKSFGK